MVAIADEHLDCAWCRRRFEDVVELLDHVLTDHVDDQAAA